MPGCGVGAVNEVKLASRTVYQVKVVWPTGGDSSEAESAVEGGEDINAGAEDVLDDSWVGRTSEDATTPEALLGVDLAPPESPRRSVTTGALRYDREEVQQQEQHELRDCKGRKASCSLSPKGVGMSIGGRQRRSEERL